MEEMRRNGVWRMAMIAALSVMGTVGVALAIAKEIKYREDPDAFFTPTDAKNERYEELMRNPSWSFYERGFRTS